MLLISHVLIALTSLAYTTLTYIRPSKKRLNVSYFLMASTLATGTFLVVSTNSSLVSACISGLVYTSIVTVGIFAAKNKLKTIALL